ncbi:hypothetical protein COV20_02320 [Candidatus Woesearchaeota archaeon CG10_big_fil_rev_8_21_14_0_10_45_16]|nr:MAG: hypothetical protein COV20_02320 [Candidatus Woesearchaeota archaeon CG10_big_fil_rev_8_21_14_0_10_45_16]
MARKSSSSSKSKGSMEIHRVAHYSFFAGVILAIVAGLFRTLISPEILVTSLVILGFFVGLFNLTAKETQPFLLAAVALMLAGIVNLGLIPGVGLYLRSILSNIVVFVVPGAIIVGLKAIWGLASD